MLERNDYVKANTKLVEKCAEAAKMLMEKMEQLHLSKLILSTGTLYYYLRESNVGSETFLSWEKCGGDLASTRVADTSGSGYYMHRDFHCWVTDASAAEFLKFANAWQEIRQKIAEIETKKTEEIEAVLNQNFTL